MRADDSDDFVMHHANKGNDNESHLWALDSCPEFICGHVNCKEVGDIIINIGVAATTASGQCHEENGY